MPKKRAINGQNHEKSVWAFSELKISFNATNGEGVLRLKHARWDAFLQLWLWSLAVEWASPACGKQNRGHGPGICSTWVGRQQPSYTWALLA